MKTLSIAIVTFQQFFPVPICLMENKEFPLSIVISAYNQHFFKICIVPKGVTIDRGSLYICYIGTGGFKSYGLVMWLSQYGLSQV
jgi:hypothetical protein